jgi:hypothetical protein
MITPKEMIMYVPIRMPNWYSNPDADLIKRTEDGKDISEFQRICDMGDEVIAASVKSMYSNRFKQAKKPWWKFWPSRSSITP